MLVVKRNVFIEEGSEENTRENGIIMVRNIEQLYMFMIFLFQKNW